MSTEIKTGWDLKQALEKIIKIIDERAGLFSDIDACEGSSIESFAKSLAKRRDEMRVALEAHYDAMEKEIEPLLEKSNALRNKMVPINMTDFAKAIPAVWSIREARELVELMERFSQLPDSSWDRLKQIAEISKQSNNNS